MFDYEKCFELDMQKIIDDVEKNKPKTQISDQDYIKWFMGVRTEIYDSMSLLLAKPECADGMGYYKQIGHDMIEDFESRNTIPVQKV